MSDENRKSFIQSSKEALTPNSSKTTGEKVKESITNLGDRIMGIVQPDTTKSLPQQASDSFTSEKDRATSEHKKNYGNDST